jgi:hypothetical protein
MSDNKLKFMLGIIATTGVVALSSVANAENTKQSVVNNILNRANLTIALSQTAPVNPAKKVNPSAGKVSPSLQNTPGKVDAQGRGAWILKPGGKNGEREWCILCNENCGKRTSPQSNQSK